MANTGLWECQKLIYNTLSEDTTLISLIDGLYDEPQTNNNYSYIVLGSDLLENTDNTLKRKGFDDTYTISIYTKPCSMGWNPAYTILNEINRLLNGKRLDMDDLYCLWCMNIGVEHEEQDEKRILHCNFRIWSQQKSLS